MGRNHQGAEDADEEIRYLTRDEAEMYAERIRAALREVGRGDLANRVTVTALKDGPECGWWKVSADCTKNFHAPDCERQEEWA